MNYFSTALKLLIGARYATTLTVSVIPTYTHFLAINLLAVVSYETMEWTVDDVSYLRLTTLGGGLISTVMVVVLSKKVEDSKMLLMQNIVTLLPIGLLMIIPHLSSISIRAILLYITAFIVGVVDSSCHILSTSMISKIVRADHQAIGEAVRLIFFFAAYAVSGFGTSAIFNRLIIGGSVVLSLNVAGIVLLIFNINGKSR